MFTIQCNFMPVSQEAMASLPSEGIQVYIHRKFLGPIVKEQGNGDCLWCWDSRMWILVPSEMVS
jgi:hypothetical protein